MKKHFHRFLFILLGSLVLFKCAKISQPTGGPKDTIPPVLEISVPINGSLNYRGRAIELKFDEYIKLDKINQELIITPKYDGSYKTKINRYTVSLELDTKLNENTTYTFTFREAIKDISEGNAPKNLSIAFSTGDYIDSIYIEGQVRDLNTNKPLEDILIGLYPVEDSLFLFNGPPTYFTETDEEGNYRINNIKVEKYFLTAFLDENSNLINESEVEPHGFKADTLFLEKSVSNVNMVLRVQDMRPLTMNNSRPSGKYYEARYNKPIKSYSIISKDSLQTNFLEENKSIRFFNTTNFQDSIQTIITAIDSIENETIDTIYVKFPETKRDNDDFKSSISLQDKSKVNEEFEFSFKFNKPIEKINFDSLFFQYDSLNLERLGPQNIEWNKLHTELKVFAHLDSTLFYKLINPEDSIGNDPDDPQPKVKKKRPPEYVKLFVGNGTFISIEGDSSKLIRRQVKFKKINELGLLAGKITTNYRSYFVQLIDNNFNVIAELKNAEDYVFAQVLPGKYKLRILIDTNENGIWEKGNVLKGKEPEPVFFYEKEIPIRANWEIYGEDFSF